MDAATFTLVLILANGANAGADRLFDSMEACEAFKQEALANQPSTVRVRKAECVRHYRIAD